MRIIFKDGQILDLNSVEKIIIEPTDGNNLSNIEFSPILKIGPLNKNSSSNKEEEQNE